MNTQKLDIILEKYSAEYLICDSSYPIITNSSLEEESQLYNLSKFKLSKLIMDFIQMTDKQANSQTNVDNLSGGQKVVLMVLFALYSNAGKIVFINIESSLDSIRKEKLMSFIDKSRINKKDILIVKTV